jgi:hypothetical protein
MTEQTPEQIRLQALIEQMEAERALAVERRRRWRIVVGAVPAMLAGLLGLLVAVVNLPFKMVSLVLESLATGLQSLASRILGLTPDEVAAALPAGRNARPGPDAKPDAPTMPPPARS